MRTCCHKGFCDAWNALIKLGLTDNSFPILESYGMTFQQFIEAFLTEDQGTIKERVARAVGEHADSEVIDMLKWLGLFSKRKIAVKQGSPAMILKQLLLNKWKMKSDDNSATILSVRAIRLPPVAGLGWRRQHCCQRWNNRPIRPWGHSPRYR